MTSSGYSRSSSTVPTKKGREKKKRKRDEQPHVLDHHITTSPESNNLLTCDNWGENRMGKNGKMNKRVIVCEISSGETLAKANNQTVEKTVGSRSSFNCRHFGLKGLGFKSFSFTSDSIVDH